MKLCSNYSLETIENKTFLIPFGQQTADNRRGMEINDTGVLIWNELCKGQEKEDILLMLKDHFHATTEELIPLETDLDAFLASLKAFGVLLEDTKITSPSHYFSIGGLLIGYEGPEQLIHPSFRDYECIASVPDQVIKVTPTYPQERKNGTILVRTKDIIIMENDAYYIIFYPDSQKLLECHLKKEGDLAIFYCLPPFDDTLRLEIFHAIRFVYLFLAPTKNLFAIHSASILYQNKAWLFSGRSGTGKSTHTNLWSQLFETPILNGDVNLIGLENETAIVYGIPWCGTSGIYTTKSYPLGGIVFLKQCPTDEILLLADADKTLFTMQRMITPTWTKYMLSKNLNFAKRLSKLVPIFCFGCTPNSSAAEIMKQEIDKL